MPRHTGQHNTSLKFDLPKDLRYRFNNAVVDFRKIEGRYFSMSEVIRIMLEQFVIDVEEQKLQARGGRRGKA